MSWKREKFTVFNFEDKRNQSSAKATVSSLTRHHATQSVSVTPNMEPQSGLPDSLPGT